MIRVLAITYLVTGCMKVDPLYCASHESDPRCDGTGDAGVVDAPPGFYTIGGIVEHDLAGSGLVLENVSNNSTDDLMIGSAGTFEFATPIEMGMPYLVTATSQPSNPSQVCSVTMGSGDANANVNDIDVNCVTNMYSVGGNVYGLGSGRNVTLLLNDADGSAIVGNGTTQGFTFSTPIASGTFFDVSVGTQPVSGGTCSVSGSNGTMGDDNVSDVTVNCEPGAYTVAGEISDLIGTVVLGDGNGDMVTLSSDGSFSFPPSTASTYYVTVTTQPDYPPVAQTCNVMNGSGALTANVINVAVVCTTNTYTIGGTVSKLNGTLVLADNGSDDLTITTSSAYKFATPIASRSTYAVTVSTQPSKQWCTVNSPSGTVTNTNITNANVTCDSGIPCGANVCGPASDTCCDPTGSPSCIGRTQRCQTGGNHPQALLDLPCATAADCSLAGTPGTCCATTSGSMVDSVRCTTACAGVTLCDPAVLAACPMGKTCQLYSPLNSAFQLYYACQ